METCTQVKTFCALDNWRQKIEVHFLALEGVILTTIPLP